MATSVGPSRRAATCGFGVSGADFPPAVNPFTPDAGATWLLTELDPEDEDTAFGLCDLGLDRAELGYVSLTELAKLTQAVVFAG